MSFPPYTENPIEFANVSYCSTGKMVMPQESPHVRSIEFRIPRFKSAPSVSSQIVGDRDASALVVYALKIADDVDGMTQISVEAQTLDGKPAKGVHHCNIVVIGSPLIHSK
jgi:hypothetical protein